MERITAINRKLLVVLLCTALVLFSALPAFGASKNSVLRVAFYPLEGFFEYDTAGHEVGYGVELLDKISQYTGIKFQYVTSDSWENTKDMLINDEADIRMPATMPTNPSTTLSYGSSSVLSTYNVMLCMGDRDDLYYQDYDTMRKLKIAVSENFYKVNSVQSYFDSIGVTEDQIVFCDEYNECRDKLLSGEVDALVSNIMDMDDSMKMLARFNSISNYISMTIDNPMLDVLDEALEEIKLDEPLFLSNLYADWFPERTTVPLTLEESAYLSSIDSLTFAFQTAEGYLSRSDSGEYYGIYVEMAKTICKKLGVDFMAVSTDDCLSGAGSTDAYAGFFYDLNYAEEMNFSLSTPIRDINYYIIQKKETDVDRDNCSIAAIKRFRYTTEYLKNQYSRAEFLYFDSYEECLQAVADGKADMTIINNYIAEYYLGMYQFSDLSARLSTEYSHLFCFAADHHNNMLASILSKAISMISDEEMTQIYILGQEQRPESNYFQAMMYQNPMLVSSIVVGIVALVIIIIMLAVFMHKSKKQNRALENALSAKSSFLARMSHDMRTPMNGILGLSYIMEDQTDLKTVKSYIPQLRESGKYLLQLINDVLDVNKMEGGKLTLHQRPCNVQKLFASVVNMVDPVAKSKSIEFSIKKSGDEPTGILADEQRVKQILVNLLSNAISFTKDGGRVEFFMETVSREGGIVRYKFIVRDNGIGMSEDFQKHLFEPFRQEGRVSVDRANGSGLGLAIVKQLVELMDGSISVKSEVDKGSEMTVYLNFPESEAEKELDPEGTEPQNINLPEGINVLLCEDHPLNAKIAIKLLEKQGAHVTWAKDGSEGVNAFKASRTNFFDIILMDIRMPVMDGLDAAKEIRSCGRDDADTVPIIAVTANAYEEDVVKTLEAGMNAHLAKPLDPQRLYRMISEYLNK